MTRSEEAPYNKQMEIYYTYVFCFLEWEERIDIKLISVLATLLQLITWIYSLQSCAELLP